MARFYSINGEDWYQKKYDVDEVHFNDKDAIIGALTNLKTKCVLLLVCSFNVIF